MNRSAQRKRKVPKYHALKKKFQPFVFLKAQTSAFIGGMADYAIMIACTELLHIHYSISILISGILGAIVNFSINRSWTYKTGNAPVGAQILKFAAVVLGSVLLKSGGTYGLTHWLKVDYKITRILTDIVVSLGFNYTLQTYWVFKAGKHSQLASQRVLR